MAPRPALPGQADLLPPRPTEERAVVRHKTFSVGTVDLDEAAFDLEVLDHDFHLFTEAGTGQEGVLYPTSDGLRLALVDPLREELAPAHRRGDGQPAARPPR